MSVSDILPPETKSSSRFAVSGDITPITAQETTGLDKLQLETESSVCPTINRKDLVDRVFKLFGDSRLVSMVSDYTDSSSYDFESLQQIIDIVKPDDANTTILRCAYPHHDSLKEYDGLRVMQLVVGEDTSVALYCIPQTDEKKLKENVPEHKQVIVSWCLNTT